MSPCGRLIVAVAMLAAGSATAYAQAGGAPYAGNGFTASQQLSKPPPAKSKPATSRSRTTRKTAPATPASQN